MQAKISKMAAARGKRPRNLSVAEKVNNRNGNMNDERIAMANKLMKGEPSNGVSARIGKVRRMRRRRRIN
jgi:hypothetical protein